MRRVVAATALLACAVPASAEDLDVAGRAFVEVERARDTWYVGEWIPLAITVGWDAAFCRDHVVQPFRRELDVPVQVVAPWLGGRDAVRTDAVPAPATVVVNGDTWGFRPERLTDVRDGRSFEARALGIAFEAREPGRVELRGEIAFTAASRFRDDFVEGRVAVDPAEHRLPWDAGALTILPLPAEGRPADFSGLIGPCSISARVVGSDPERPEVLRVEVRVTSTPWSPSPSMPDLTAIDGLHVVGTLRASGWEPDPSGSGSASMTVVHEVEVTDASLRALPPISLSYLDPGSGTYRTARTEPVPLPDLPAFGAAPRAPAPGTGVLPLLVGVALALIAVGVVLARRRRLAALPERLDAAEVARRALDAPGADPADVLADFLAARLGCARAAVISPDLAKRLTAAGVATGTARTAARLLERLVAARYGGTAVTEHDRHDVADVITRVTDGA